MKIQYSDSKLSPKEGSFIDTIVLCKDDWDDFGYKTSFYMAYLDNKGKVKSIGNIKIYYWDFDSARDVNFYMHKVCTCFHPNEEIKQLNNMFCSLGQELKFYSNIKKYCPNDYMDILSRLNDLATNQMIQERFLSQNGVQQSLLRYSSAEKALREAADLLNTDQLKENDVSFSYKARVPYMGEIPITLDFKFKKDPYLPYRINALIGKNGTGKTQVLTMLADNLSGMETSADAFEEGRPPFYKVISISYSAFDSFKVRNRENIKNNGDMQSYVYCGIQSKDGTLSLQQLSDNFRKAFSRIENMERLDSWKIIMSEVMEPEHVKLVEKILRGETDNINWSSGQHILVCTLTEVLANIEKESIILFDEPEIHLHPNAVSNTMRMLNRMLEEYNSYAIIATHSPLIIQEIPSKYIQVLEREHDLLTVRSPGIECFGENITQITNEVFDVKSSESNYRTCLRKALDSLGSPVILGV